MYAALDLYGWNAQVSSALLTPLHICEVVLRNAVAEGIERQYGPRWPWSTGFQQSLPNPPKAAGYNPRNDLSRAAAKHSTTGKVIPEVKFVFWQKMFTSRHDSRIWERQLKTLFPYLDQAKTVAQLRTQVYEDFERIRLLRNRIAHHEPILGRNRYDEMTRIHNLVLVRSHDMHAWMQSIESATASIAHRP